MTTDEIFCLCGARPTARSRLAGRARCQACTDVDERVRVDAYRPPFVAESVASGVAAEAIAADDATRETASTRVIEAPPTIDVPPEDIARAFLLRFASTNGDDVAALVELLCAVEAPLLRRRQAAEKERDEARAEIARLADAVALYLSQQAADWARIATLNKERDEARDVIRLHEEDEARVFTLCGVMPEDVRGDPAVAVERLKAERDEARAERDGLRDEVVAELGDIGHDYVRSPADGVRVLVSRLDDAIARAEKAEAELAASRASDAANRKQWRTETTWHLEKFEQIRTACSRALGDEAAGKGAVEAAIACAAKVAALQAELAAREKANPWRLAVDDALVNWEMIADDNPKAALARLLAIETQTAADPLMSQAAADLVASRDKTIRGLDAQVKTLREAARLHLAALDPWCQADCPMTGHLVANVNRAEAAMRAALAATAPPATDDATAKEKP